MRVANLREIALKQYAEQMRPSELEAASVKAERDKDWEWWGVVRAEIVKRNRAGGGSG